MTDRERFMAKVEVDPKTACWIWTGAATGHRYPVFWFRGERWGAHRLAYVLVHGPIPVGCEVHHTCDRPLCVNADHLQAITHRENMLLSSAPSAENARKTHCHRGHAFDEVNTYRRRDGTRDCRACRRAANRRWDRRQRQPEGAVV